MKNKMHYPLEIEEKKKLILSISLDKMKYLLKYLLNNCSVDYVNLLFEFCDSRYWFEENTETKSPNNFQEILLLKNSSLNSNEVKGNKSKENSFLSKKIEQTKNFRYDPIDLIEKRENNQILNFVSTPTRRKKSLLNKNSSLIDEIVINHPNEDSKIEKTLMQHVNYSITNDEINNKNKDEKQKDVIFVEVKDTNKPSSSESSNIENISNKMVISECIDTIHQSPPRIELLEKMKSIESTQNKSLIFNLINKENSPSSKRKRDQNDPLNDIPRKQHINNFELNYKIIEPISSSTIENRNDINVFKQSEFSPHFFDQSSPDLLTLDECNISLMNLKKNPIESMSQDQFYQLKNIWFPKIDLLLRETSEIIASHEVGEEISTNKNMNEKFNFHLEKRKYQQILELRNTVITLIRQYIQQTTDNILLIGKLNTLKKEWVSLNEERKIYADEEWKTLFSQPKWIQLSRFIYYYGPEKGIREWVRVEKASNCLDGISFASLFI